MKTNSYNYVKASWILVFGCVLFGCGNGSHIVYYTENTKILNTGVPDRLPGRLLIDDLYGISNVEVADSLLVLISPRNEKLFAIFDFGGNPKGDFGLKGQGPNDLLNVRPTGQSEVWGGEAYMWVNDISNTSLKRVNLSQSVLQQQLLVDSIVPAHPMSLNAFVISDSVVISERMIHDNYTLIQYDHKNQDKISEELIYQIPQQNPFSFYKSIWRVNPRRDKIVGAMFAINQLNLWDLNTQEKKSVVIGQHYNPDQVVDKESGLEYKTFFCDLEVSEDFIFALYMDQDYDVSYEEPKEMLLFVFDWNLSLVKTYELGEYILDIAMAPTQKMLYGVSEDNSVFAYDIADLFSNISR